MEPANKRYRSDVGTDLLIQSVVATGDIGRELDIKAIEKNSKEFPETSGIKFSEKFQGLYIKRKTEGVSGIVFKSGKMICYGAKTEVFARTAVASMLTSVRQYVYPTKTLSSMPSLEGAKVVNIIAQFSMGFDLQLEHLAIDHKKDVVYEPEIFRTLIFTVQKVTAFISAKGKVLLTGAKFDEELKQAHKYLVPILSKYRRDGPCYRRGI